MAETTLTPQVSTSSRDAQGAFRVFLTRLRTYRPGFFSLILLILLYLVAFAGPLFMRYSPNELDLTNMLASPSLHHLLGTDDNGRDVFARLVYGGRISLVVGLFAVLIADSVGVLLGAVSGYFGKITDQVVMRITDAMLAIPSFLLLAGGPLALHSEPDQDRAGYRSDELDDRRPPGTRRVLAPQGLGFRTGRAIHRRVRLAHHVPSSAAAGGIAGDRVQ